MFFFSHDTSTTQTYSLSLHDALPISAGVHHDVGDPAHQVFAEADLGVHDAAGRQHLSGREVAEVGGNRGRAEDRKSTRLNSSHVAISYAVFCLKKKKAK